MFNEMYFDKILEYIESELHGRKENGELYKGSLFW